MIGIVSHADDLHAVAVRRHLDAAGARHVLLDTATVPSSASLTTRQTPQGGWSGTWETPDGTVDLAALRAMWWRRPQPFTLHDELVGGDDRGFAHGECASLVAGLWTTLDAEWVNDPDLDETASRKMWQLRLAASIGLRVPRTCMTNDPASARAFVGAEPEGVIYKPFSGTPRTWRETRPVGPDDLDRLDLVRLAPVIFQEYVPGGGDVRVTIVGDEVFAARITAASTGYEYDFRVDPDPHIVEHRLPADVESALLALMRRLGLRYGAVDLRLAPDGGYVFLEINPAGQWLFVEIATGQPITAALAGLLARLDRAPAEHGVERGRARA
ncbi:hypothetical protein CLV28_1110 [Sediminihabitans luteus]|uniref:ATP-grasp domain-containing protein n=1 Tax=Sediminihabitans luteus TaxID=1138585 RepID=A0A2M9D104_9CELL|nr:alpha-L-glutamate ligase [Sediminihabitans luteus]PJJ77884.1 hypothetical protein CLV28_1110 [Sediminihabitans luteus]GII99758.1 ATP-grasp ribosomal peptide maturase [Sediminihabitans luteus]